MKTRKQIKTQIEKCREVVMIGNKEGHGAESKKNQIQAHTLCWVLE